MHNQPQYWFQLKDRFDHLLIESPKPTFSASPIGVSKVKTPVVGAPSISIHWDLAKAFKLIIPLLPA